MQRPLTNANKNLAAISNVIGAFSSESIDGIEISGIAQSSDDVVAGEHIQSDTNLNSANEPSFTSCGLHNLM